MTTSRLRDLRPEELVHYMRGLGIRRAFLVHDPSGGDLRPSHPDLEPLARFLAGDTRDFHTHEGVFLEIGRDTGALMGTFVHDTHRGQGAGGVRHWPYPTVEAFLRDGLRLARGMTRKNALAGLWWGGGKAVIARQPGDRFRDPGYRASAYTDFAEFVTGLRGCYVTAEDAGTMAEDMAIVHAHTRFATCIPPHVGGSGNPSPATATGVVCAMEGALDFLGLGTLSGKTVAMQGAGNVGTPMIEDLLARDVARIIATEIDEHRYADLAERFAGKPVELRLVDRGDPSILAQDCDILAPNALGGILGPETIPRIQAKVVCGAANNQLLDEPRDATALLERGITYVPDFVCNRMGIVHCANEQYGYVPDDPTIRRHFGRDWDNSVFLVTRRVLELARDENIPTAMAANRLADQAAAHVHPVWGHRGRAIIDGLVRDGWADD